MHIFLTPLPKTYTTNVLTHLKQTRFEDIYEFLEKFYKYVTVANEQWKTNDSNHLMWFTGQKGVPPGASSNTQYHTNDRKIFVATPAVFKDSSRSDNYVRKPYVPYQSKQSANHKISLLATRRSRSWMMS